MEHDPLSAVLLQQAVELNSTAGRLRDLPDMKHRRVLTNRISDSVMLTTAALNTAASRWHSDVLSRLRRISGLRAAESGLRELDHLISGARAKGYVTTEEAEPLFELLARITAMVDALANGERQEIPRAA